MSRTARKNLETQYYHVIVQGINKSFIFNDAKSKYIYLKYISIYAKENNIDILAYCMMDNHAHFIMHSKEPFSLGKCMHKTNLIFSNYYNEVNERVGVIFRNRYKSEPIYNISYLSNCIKYIHENPVKAGMVKHAKEYPLSSYNEIFNNTGKSIINKELINDILGNDFKNKINKSNTMLFFDIDIDRNKVFLYIEDGINEYLKKKNSNIVLVYSDRTEYIKMINYLHNECKIKLKYLFEYFGMTKNTWFYLDKNKAC